MLTVAQVKLDADVKKSMKRLPVLADALMIQIELFIMKKMVLSILFHVKDVMRIKKGRVNRPFLILITRCSFTYDIFSRCINQDMIGCFSCFSICLIQVSKVGSFKNILICYTDTVTGIMVFIMLRRNRIGTF